MTPTFRQYHLPERKGFACLAINDVPKRRPQYGQILIRLKAVSLTWRDCAIAKGIYAYPGESCEFPGSDGAGTIEEIGEGVTEWKAGDRVVTTFIQDHLSGKLSAEAVKSCLAGGRPGILGEYVILPEAGVVKIPDYLSFEEASCLPCSAVTAWNALYGAVPVQPGDVVVLQGTGGVATFGLQIARAAGAVTIVTSSSDEKLAKARELGAVHVINYRTSDWAKEVKVLTQGHGADHILEVGGIATLPQSFKAVAWSGIIHSIGHITNMIDDDEQEKPSDATFMTIDQPYMLRRIIVGSREQFHDLIDCFAANSIRPVINKVFDFGDAKEAYEYLWSSSHVGKVVICIPQ